jgi:hypothetical protein
MDSSRYNSESGQSVTFTAKVMGNSGTPTGTVAFRDNGSTIAACSAVPVSATLANCTVATLAIGSHAITGVYSGDSVYGTGVAGPITQAVSGVLNTSAAVNVQGLWWRSSTGSESGWGVNFTQQGDTLFATWFTYDTDGSGLWLVMSNGVKTAANTYSGTFYRTTGPAFGAGAFNSAQVNATAVGSATFAFSDANNGTFTATVNGNTIAKPITRQVYQPSVPACTAGGNAAASSNYQDLWWNAGGTESGWGMNVTHQGDLLFVTWFTYDASGKGMWLVASNVARTGNGTYAGRLYRTTGPAYHAASFDPSRVAASDVGSIAFSFANGAAGSFTATVNGVTVSKSIVREVFDTPATVCN